MFSVSDCVISAGDVDWAVSDKRCIVILLEPTQMKRDLLVFTPFWRERSDLDLDIQGNRCLPKQTWLWTSVALGIACAINGQPNNAKGWVKIEEETSPSGKTVETE
jgi:hypothetical protein